MVGKLFLYQCCAKTSQGFHRAVPNHSNRLNSRLLRPRPPQSLRLALARKTQTNRLPWRLLPRHRRIRLTLRLRSRQQRRLVRYNNHRSMLYLHPALRLLHLHRNARSITPFRTRTYHLRSFVICQLPLQLLRSLRTHGLNLLHPPLLPSC